MNRRTSTILVMLSLLFTSAIAQVNIDSIRRTIKTSSDTHKLKAIDALAIELYAPDSVLKWGKLLEGLATEHPYWHAMGIHHQARAMSSFGKPEKSNELRYKAVELFASIDRQDKMARQLLSIGNNLANMALYDSALSVYNQSEQLAREAEDHQALSGAYLNISTIYHERGEREQELTFLLKSLEAAKKLKDKAQAAVIYFNLGVFYIESGEQKKAVEQMKTARALYAENNDLNGLGSIYNFMAKIHYDNGQLDSTIHYLDLAIDIYEKIGEVGNVAYITMNQGETLFELGRIDESKAKFEKAYKTFVSIGENRFAAKCLHHIATFNHKQGNNQRAIEELREALKLADQIGILADQTTWSKELAGLYNVVGNTDSAYVWMVRHTTFMDSLQQSNREEAIQEMEAKYQNEKKQLEIENLEKEQDLQNARLKNEQAKRRMLLGGLFVAILLILLVSYGFVVKRRDNKLIAAQKDEVEHQRDKINRQKLLVEEKNREITDSITYAKRIQEAILPPASQVQKYLENGFILYKPKAIVAGDFYWLERKGDLTIFAAADCTGHGVPGAMVSVICSNALNRSVREYGLTKPSEILDKTRDIVIERFEKSQEEVKDGMDIALCALNTKTGELHYAGAQNPLWIVTQREIDDLEELEGRKLEDDNLNLYEVKGDKQPIGKYAEPQPFTNHTIQLSAGDTIYLFSDGYADQFGGPRSKKFKYKPFKELLISLNEKLLSEQKTILDQHFEDWRGDLEQIDDVCVIGVRV